MTNRNEIYYRLEEFGRHIEDIAMAQDQMTKALITIHNDMKIIANKINVKLSTPLVNMDYEKGTLKAGGKNIVDIEIDDDAEEEYYI